MILEIALIILVFLFILSLLVLIHEAGHFFVAKKFNIKVEEFGYGLPPRAWGKRIGETIYSINWLPFGGFVKLYGEDEAGSGSVKVAKNKLPTKELDRAFFTRPVGQRAAVVVAGVVMNFLLAVILFYTFLGISGFKTELPLYTDYRFFGVEQQNKIEPIITYIAPNSPAQKSGIQPLSKILSVNGIAIKDPTEFTQVAENYKGKEITLTLQNLSTQKDYSVTLIPRVNPPKGEGAIGIALGVPMAVLDYGNPVHKFFSGLTYPINLLVYQYDVLKMLVSTSVQTNDVAPVGQAVQGPIGIGSVVGDILKLPPKDAALQLLNLTGLLSLSLAFFNVLPIPALDGGRLFFILIEAVTRKKVSPDFEAKAHTVGMAVLLSLIILITFKDIFQLFR